MTFEIIEYLTFNSTYNSGAFSAPLQKIGGNKVLAIYAQMFSLEFLYSEQFSKD
jgi:hypothetical protein